jgi:hypothetical protein
MKERKKKDREMNKERERGREKIIKKIKTYAFIYGVHVGQHCR